MRDARALELRCAGATYWNIAQALGFRSKGSAHRAVERALQAEIGSVSDIRERYRRTQIARCQRLVRATWPAALKGDLGAISVVVKILEREARLLGLDAPATMSVSVRTHDHLLEMLGELEELIHAEINLNRDEQAEIVEAVVVDELQQRLDGNGD